MRMVVVVTVSACATTTSTCPVGTKPVVAQEAGGRAEWCATTDKLNQKVSVGRTFDSALGIEPASLAGGVEGPFTSWYASGSLSSHGHYTDFGARSVPEGVWAFWYANGKRRMLGAYHRGEPVGCFVVWEQDGARKTGYVEGRQLRVATCTPPGDEQIAQIEAGITVAPPSPAWADLSLQTFVGPNGIGARNAEQTDPDPSLAVALNVIARKRVGRLRIGPEVSLRLSDNMNYGAYAGAATIAYELPSLHRRLDTEIAAELGARYITAAPARPGLGSRSRERLGFWSPLPAAQLTVALALSDVLEAIVAARIEGWPLGSELRQPEYCDYLGCYHFEPETWRIGGFGYGINLGLRLMIR